MHGEALVSTAKDRPGCVYLIRGDSPQGVLHKIGRSIDTPRRLRTLRRYSDQRNLALLFALHVSDCVMAERYLHRRFARLRHAGEWFRLSPVDIEQVRFALLCYQTEALTCRVLNKLAARADTDAGSLSMNARLLERLATRQRRRQVRALRCAPKLVTGGAR